MIEIKDLVKYYGDKKAVDGISFTVNDDEVLGFLGPNGAGKSTTMNIITGFLSSTSGTVEVDGYDILEEPLKAKANIGYLPELPPLYLDMTVKEYLDFIADLKGVSRKDRREHIEKIVNLVRIDDVYERIIGNLSKGYKQRVGIAQALVGDPKTLILDEPTVGLDPNQILEIRKLIKMLSKNHSIIISSHILSEIQATCDRVVIINQGRIAAIDTIDDLSKRISGADKLMMSFRGDPETVINNILSFPGIVDVKETGSSDDVHEVEITLEEDSDNDVRSSIFFAMARGGYPVLELKSKKISLEEMFYNITKMS